MEERDERAKEGCRHVQRCVDEEQEKFVAIFCELVLFM
jgi:hypothetical protein